MFGEPLREITVGIRRLRSSRRTTVESYALSPSTASGRRRGRRGRPATSGMPSTSATVWAMSLTLAAVVRAWSGAPLPSQIRSCLLPDFRQSAGDGPVPAPPFFRADGGAVHARAGPVEFAGYVHLPEQELVKLVKDARLLPAAQSSPTGLTGAEPQPGVGMAEGHSTIPEPLGSRPEAWELQRPPVALLGVAAMCVG